MRPLCTNLLALVTIADMQSNLELTNSSHGSVCYHILVAFLAPLHCASLPAMKAVSHFALVESASNNIESWYSPTEKNNDNGRQAV